MNSENVLIIMGRDDWQRDMELNQILLDRFIQKKVRIIWEDAAAHWIFRLRKLENKLPWLSESIRLKNLRLLQLIYGLFHWSYFSYLRSRPKMTFEGRCKHIRSVLLKHKIKGNAVALSRSAGGRAATLLADEFQFRHTICLGYPFENPHHGEQPERYMHLKHITTPTLIIQGSDDPYGGMEVKERYKLSKSIELVFVETNHDFTMPKQSFDYVIQKIESITAPYFPAN